MLSSIHPLGERARSNRWWVTVAAFAVGASIGGAVLGVVAAVAGASTRFSSAPASVLLVAVGAAAVADLLRIRVPTPHRQVNERWIGTYRGWVYGGGFGLQLGAGLATYVVTWLVPALVVSIAWIGDPVAGAWVGATFGLSRTIPLLAAGWIDRPDRLGAFHQKVAAIAAPTHSVAAATALALVIAGGVVL